jgi:hypothetical protein
MKCVGGDAARKETGQEACLTCRCGADVMKTGVMLEHTTRETYMAVGGGMQRVATSHDEPDMAYCLLCAGPLAVDVAALVRRMLG